MNPNQETNKWSALQLSCAILSVLFLGAGAVGLVLSFLFLASQSAVDMTAGSSGFIAGAVLMGTGLVALALVSREA